MEINSFLIVLLIGGLFNGLSTFMCYLMPAILVEQQWYYLNHSRKDNLLGYRKLISFFEKLFKILT